MAELAPGTLWFTIAALALGTYLIRFSFLGFLGGRTLPPLALRLLRYVPVAVFPALVARQGRSRLVWPRRWRWPRSRSHL